MTIDEMQEILKSNLSRYDNSDFYYPPVGNAGREYIALSEKQDAEISECWITQIYKEKGTTRKDETWTVYSLDNGQKVVYFNNISKTNYFLQNFSNEEALGEDQKRFYEEKNKYSIYKHAIYLQKLLKTAEATAINSQYDKYVNKKYPFSGEEIYKFKILNAENKKIYDYRKELGLGFHEFKQLLNS